MIDLAKENPVSFLVAGDPFCATTHADLFLRAVKLGVKVQVIHNASIMNAIAACGLSLYRFGQTVSVPLFTQKWRPYSFYQKIAKNYANGMHTLLLLDIKMKQPTEKMLLTGKGGYMPPNFMTADIASSQLIEAEKVYKSQSGEDFSECCQGTARVFGVARIGSKDQRILAGKLEHFTCQEYVKQKLGGPLHAMVLCAKQLHPIEQQMFQFYSCSGLK